MKKTMIRCLGVSSLSLMMLAGCSSKKLEAKVKQLEKEMEELQISHDEAISRKDQMIGEKVAALDEASGKSRDKISELTGERDRLNNTVRDLQLKFDRLQAEANARKPAAGSAAGDGPDLSKDPKFSAAMVSIVGDVSKSTGVVIEDGGKRYIYTSGDTLGGNTRLSITNSGGTRFTKFGSLQTADGCSLVRIELLDDSAAAIPLATGDVAVSGQSSLFCLSLNPGENGAVAGSRLTAFNQTDSTVECDVSVLAGKAGAAILDASTGRILAVVVSQSTEVSSLWERPADPSQVQSAAMRVNRGMSWQSVPIKAFLDEGRKLKEFNRVTRVVHAFGGMMPAAEGLGMSSSAGESGTVQSVLAAASDLPIAAEAVALDAQLSQKKVRLGEADFKKRLKGLFSGVASLSKTSAAGLAPASFSTYHRKAAEQALMWRGEADKKLQRMIEGVDTIDFKAPDRRPDKKLDNNQ